MNAKKTKTMRAACRAFGNDPRQTRYATLPYSNTVVLAECGRKMYKRLKAL